MCSYTGLRARGCLRICCRRVCTNHGYELMRCVSASSILSGWIDRRSLNALRRKRGLNTFSYRPHCGEAHRESAGERDTRGRRKGWGSPGSPPSARARRARDTRGRRAPPPDPCRLGAQPPEPGHPPFALPGGQPVPPGLRLHAGRERLPRREPEERHGARGKVMYLPDRVPCTYNIIYYDMVKLSRQMNVWR